MELNLFIQIGYSFNALCFLHYIYMKGYGQGIGQIFTTIIFLLMPLVGFSLYFIIYLWNPKNLYGSGRAKKAKERKSKRSYKEIIRKLTLQNQKDMESYKSKKYHFGIFGRHFYLIARIALFMFGVFIIGIGIRSIIHGDMTYTNHFGLTVYGPFSILIGLLCIYLAVFKWSDVKKDI